MTRFLTSFVTALFMLGLALPVTASDSGDIPQRDEIADKYKWRVEDIYETIEDWEADYAHLDTTIDNLRQYEGKLAESPEMLLGCLQLSDSLDIIIGNLYVYAYLKLDEDSRESKYQELGGRVSSLNSRLGAAQSFIRPEILAMDAPTLMGFLDREPELVTYRFYLEDLIRQKEHILNEEQENLLAMGWNIFRAPRDIFNMIESADLKLGTVIGLEGDTVDLTWGRYRRIMREGDRDLRRAANDTVQNQYKKYINSLAATLGSSVQKDWYLAQVRDYNSCLDYALDGDNIPTEVFHNLVQAVNDSIHVLHKWTALKKKALGVDTLYTFDTGVPLVPEFNKEYTYEQAMDLLVEGLEPMGEEYVERVQEGLTGGWIDVYENEGKATGAYSWGTYTSHPYIMLNYADRLGDVFTLAHEMGHALNSWYTNRSEPYIYHNHSLFTAEVASTCNEAVLIQHLLDRTESKQEKLALLNYYIEQIEGTFFIQVMFSEFEQKIHQHVEEGGATSVDYFRQTYREIFEKYSGPDLVIGPDNDMGGMKISHFYRQFYVYQYATSYAAAQALSQKILAEEEGALEKYMQFLAVGSSQYPVDILKDAGIDMSSPEPIYATINLFSQLVDEMERLLLEG
jgi:oligoendopeptidase F